MTVTVDRDRDRHWPALTLEIPICFNISMWLNVVQKCGNPSLTLGERRQLTNPNGVALIS